MTEIHYFKTYRENQIEKAFYDVLHNYSEFYSEEISFRKFESALHSGREKAEWFAANRAKNVVNKVSDLFQKNNGNKYLWNNIWNNIQIYRFDNTIEEKINEGLCYLYFIFLLFVLCLAYFETAYSNIL